MERMRQWMESLIAVQIYTSIWVMVILRSDTLNTPSRGDAYGYPCRKDARRMQCGRSADQAQRCDGGHKCQLYVSRTVVPWSRDPVQ